MSQVRDVDERVTVTVACCSHCHGDTGDCPDRTGVEETQARLAANAREALDLLERAHEHLRLRRPGGWAAGALQDDLYLFLNLVGSAVAR